MHVLLPSNETRPGWCSPPQLHLVSVVGGVLAVPLNMIWSSAKSLLTPQSRNDQSWIMTVSDAQSDTFSEKSKFQIRLGFGFGSGLPYCPRVKASAAPLELFSGRLIRLLLIRAVSRWMNTADFGDPRIIL